VLNAKQHEREAEIVAQAGRLGAVTIATNMAGRGTDIMLGGNPEFMAKHELIKKGYDEFVVNSVTSPVLPDVPDIEEAKALYDELYGKFKVTTDEESEKVKTAGGLHIIGTERHESRRIDNQLRGRAGRQGDPGSSQFYISFEDDLMRLFVSDRAKSIVESLGMEEDMQLENKMLSKAIENAQKKVEGRNFGIRKHVLQYDDVMNKQREIIYGERNRVLHGDNIKDNITGMIDKVIERAIPMYTDGYKYPEEWDLEGLFTYLSTIYLPKGAVVIENIETMTTEKLHEMLSEKAQELYAVKEEEIGPERMREVERAILLRVVDMHWIDHIDAMDDLKQGIGLRAIGQQDPVIAYKMEGFEMFDEMIANIQQETVKALFHATLQTDTERKRVAVITGTSGGDQAQAGGKKPFKADKKVGRNDPCPCGSGKKYKKCHGMYPDANE
jgi:preprotein translocase subunit SecA